MGGTEIEITGLAWGHEERREAASCSRASPRRRAVLALGAVCGLGLLATLTVLCLEEPPASAALATRVESSPALDAVSTLGPRATADPDPRPALLRARVTEVPSPDLTPDLAHGVAQLERLTETYPELQSFLDEAEGHPTLAGWLTREFATPLGTGQMIHFGESVCPVFSAGRLPPVSWSPVLEGEETRISVGRFAHSWWLATTNATLHFGFLLHEIQRARTLSEWGHSDTRFRRAHEKYVSLAEWTEILHEAEREAVSRTKASLRAYFSSLEKEPEVLWMALAGGPIGPASDFRWWCETYYETVLLPAYRRRGLAPMPSFCAWNGPRAYGVERDYEHGLRQLARVAAARRCDGDGEAWRGLPWGIVVEGFATPLPSGEKVYWIDDLPSEGAPASCHFAPGRASIRAREFTGPGCEERLWCSLVFELLNIRSYDRFEALNIDARGRWYSMDEFVDAIVEMELVAARWEIALHESVWAPWCRSLGREPAFSFQAEIDAGALDSAAAYRAFVRRWGEGTSAYYACYEKYYRQVLAPYYDRVGLGPRDPVVDARAASAPGAR